MRKKITEAILAAGSSQLFWYASLPIITRLYTKDAIGLFGTFLSYASFVGLVIGARSDLAILTSKKTSVAVTRSAFVKLSYLILAIVTLIIFVAGYLTRIPLLSFPNSLLVLAGGALLFRFSLEGACLIKVGDYSALRSTAFSRSFGQSLIQLTMFKFHFVGLIFGRMAGDLLGARMRQSKLKRLGHLSTSESSGQTFSFEEGELTSLKANANAYKYSFPQTLLNSLSQALPFLVLPQFTTLAWMGQYTLAFTIAVAPVGLVSTPIRQLLVANFSDARHGGTADNGRQKTHVVKASLSLMFLSIVGSIFIAFQGQHLVDLVFGKNWDQTGALLFILWFWAGSGLILTPAIAYLLAHEGNRDHLVIETIQFVGRVAAIALGVSCFSGLNMIVPFVAWCAAANLMACLWIVWRR